MSDDLFGGELDGAKSKPAKRAQKDNGKRERAAARSEERKRAAAAKLAAPKPKSGIKPKSILNGVHPVLDGASPERSESELARATRLFEKFGLIKPGGKNAAR